MLDLSSSPFWAKSQRTRRWRTSPQPTVSPRQPPTGSSWVCTGHSGPSREVAPKLGRPFCPARGSGPSRDGCCASASASERVRRSRRRRRSIRGCALHGRRGCCLKAARTGAACGRLRCLFSTDVRPKEPCSPARSWILSTFYAINAAAMVTAFSVIERVGLGIGAAWTCMLAFQVVRLGAFRLRLRRSRPDAAALGDRRRGPARARTRACAGSREA